MIWSMAYLRIFIDLAAGSLFLLSAAGYIYVRLTMRPGQDSDLDEYHYEFEDRHEGLARYEKWSRIAYMGVIISLLLLFLGIVF